MVQELEERCVPAVTGVVEFPIPTAASSPSSIASAADGNLWFTSFGSDRIGRITTAGVITEFTLTAGSGPLDIVSGPDGLLYFTEQTSDRIGRINPLAGSTAAIQGSVVEFIVPGVGSLPTSIALGPDNNLWFTEAGSDEIGRLTTAGVITEFAVPAIGGIPSVPSGITAGPDGALWFTEAGSDEIGRISVSGVVTNEFPVPTGTPTSSPANIALGSDGNLWFTEQGSDEIGRITTAGVITEFSLTVGAAPTDITAGPDGALFFTQPGTDSIGRITTAGALTVFTMGITAASAPGGITTGPDNAIWFTETLGNRIGRLGVNVADIYAVGADAGAGPHVRVFNQDGTERFSFFAYGTGFTGGVRVATGDVTGDGFDDIITGAGPGAGPHVKVFDGRTGAEVRSFFAYAPGFAGGVNVAAADVNGDGRADIITGAGDAAPHVVVFDGATGAVLQSFFAYANFSGGITVGAGDVTGDGRADIVTGTGPGGGSHVKVFNGVTGAETRSFFAFNQPTTGVFVGAERGDIIVGTGSGITAQVRVIRAADLSDRANFQPFGGFQGGVRVAFTDRNGDGTPDYLVGAGPGAGPQVRILEGATLAQLDSFFAFAPTFAGGIFVG